MFPLLRQKTPLLDKIRGNSLFGNKLTESQQEMAEEFRRGIAEALGVPPETIQQGPVQKWIVNFTKAFVKPEHWKEVAPQVGQIRNLGKQIGSIIANALSRETRTVVPQEEVEPERKYSNDKSDISLVG